MPRTDCIHSPHPRKDTRCLKCDAEIPPTVRDRNPEVERDIIEQAARGILDPTELLERMDTRAASLSSEYVRDAGSVALDRDRPREVREEAEDAFNHARWWLEDHLEHPRAQKRSASLRLLAEFYVAWGEED